MSRSVCRRKTFSGTPLGCPSAHARLTALAAISALSQSFAATASAARRIVFANVFSLSVQPATTSKVTSASIGMRLVGTTLLGLR